jgi:C-terminal processing protease CtpA/Prc
MAVKLKKIIPVLYLLILITGCSTARHSFNPGKKIPKEQLQQDFNVFRHVLEEGHPSLYWYTPKDSMDAVFDLAYNNLPDSLTETAFRTRLSYVTSRINCGHTSVRYSKNYSRHLDTAKRKQFPLSIKFWDDTAVIYANLNRKDTVLTRGTIIKSINGYPISFYKDSLFRFLTMDGYSFIHKYQTLSNQGVFGGWYRNVFGLKDRFSIGYETVNGKTGTLVVPVYDPAKSYDRKSPGAKRTGRKERKKYAIHASRNVIFDANSSSAVLTMNTFSRGNNLTGFIKKTFRRLDRMHIQHLIIDVRSNGGGNVGIANLLTRLIIDHRFKMADSLYAINKRSRYGKYIQNYGWNKLSMSLITRKRRDGKYHFGYFERHYFSPKKKNHFDGAVYIVTGGNSFSATTLFANALKGQKNVLLVGEETGGAAYGNTAWMIPEVTLPNSRIRFRLPKFRMVVDKDIAKNGRGVQPDVLAGPNLESIRKGTDPKLEKVKQIILQRDSTVNVHSFSF